MFRYRRMLYEFFQGALFFDVLPQCIVARVIFHSIIKEQLRSLSTKNRTLYERIHAMLIKLETIAPDSGKLLDNHEWLYEIKSKRPPMRIYYQWNRAEDKLIALLFEMKKNEKNQKETISRLQLLLRDRRGYILRFS